MTFAAWRRPVGATQRVVRIALALWRQIRISRWEAPRVTVFTDELPDALDHKAVYVVGEGDYIWFLALMCPCGCGAVLQMSLHRDGRPRWRLMAHGDGTVSLKPSVWRRTGCRSHFFLRRGRIEWCDIQ